ncbi:MAG: lipopolysaccharide biosynthesis protein [Tepidisphaeraceae bacterium]
MCWALAARRSPPRDLISDGPAPLAVIRHFRLQDQLTNVMPEGTIVLRNGSRLTPHRAADAAVSAGLRELDTIEESTPRRRGFWALTDQGIVSLGNCVTNVLLARSLTVDDFGTFALLLEAVIFLNSLQAALVVYPLSIRGAVQDRHGVKRLAGACLLLTLGLAFPMSLAVTCAAGARGIASIGLLAGVAMLLWQCHETLRRAMMAQGGFRAAVVGDVISYVGQAVGVAALAAMGALTVPRAFCVIGLTSGLGIIVQVCQIGPSFAGLSRVRDVARDFWRFGRWVLLGNLTTLVTTLGCSWTLAIFHGRGAVGEFQALANFLKLSNPLFICVAGLIVPAAALALADGGLPAARQVAVRYALRAAVGLAPYYLVLFVFPTSALRWLYGHQSHYGALGHELRAFVLWYAALFVAMIGQSLLNAIQKSHRTFVAQIAHAAAVIFVALPLTAVYGLDGLMLGGVIGNIVLAAACLSLVRRLEERHDDSHARLVVREMLASARLAA